MTPRTQHMGMTSAKGNPPNFWGGMAATYLEIPTCADLHGRARLGWTAPLSLRFAGSVFHCDYSDASATRAFGNSFGLLFECGVASVLRGAWVIDCLDARHMCAQPWCEADRRAWNLG